MSITVSRKDVSFTDLENQYVGSLEEIMSRSEFESMFGISLVGIQTLAYEPDRNIFHIERDNKVEVYQDPSEEPTMHAIATKEPQIKNMFELIQLAKLKPSEYHELVDKVWTITPEKQAKLDRESFERGFRATRDKLLDEADVLIYKAEDTGQDTAVLRSYRQALRDATLTWVLPSMPVIS